MNPDSTQQSTGFYEFLAWVEMNKKRLLFGAAAVLLLIVVLIVLNYLRDSREAVASDSLLALRPLYGAAERGNNARPEELLRVTANYPSTSAGERALVLAASTLFTDGKYAEAQNQFAKFLADYRSSPLAGIAALGVAASLDAQDKLDAALAAYQDVAAKYPEDPVAARASLAVAALYEAKQQPEQALKTLEALSKPAIYGNTAMEAMMRKEQLLQRHPSLVRTNAAVLAPAPASAPGTNPAVKPAAPAAK